MHAVAKYISELEVGKPQTYNNLSIVPLFGPVSNLDYLTLDQATSEELENKLHVTETKSVPVLNFKNETGKNILILPGDYLQGGSQDRMVVNPILMKEGYEGEIQVNCVERGRWNHSQPNQFKSACRRATSTVRHASSEGQGATWAAVRRIAASTQTHSFTENLGDSYEQKKEDISGYLTNIKMDPKAIGIAAVLQHNGEKVYHSDIFSSPATLDANFSKILESYAMEALTGKEVQVASNEINSFLKRILKSELTEKDGTSLGKQIVIVGDNIQGTGLTFEKTPLYVSLSSQIIIPRDVQTGPISRRSVGRR
jgi:hypothetical protein